MPDMMTIFEKARAIKERLATDAASCIGVHYDGRNLTTVRLARSGSQIERQDRQDQALPEVTSEDETVQASPSFSDEPLTDALRQLADRLDLSGRTRTPVVLSISASLYRSLNHHSDFDNPKMIRQTLRYDIEDALMLDAETIYLCYQPLPTPGDGVDLVVHTIERNVLQGITDAFEQARLDALALEPDVASWTHYLDAVLGHSEREPVVVLAGFGDMLYLLILNDQGQPVITRTSYCPRQDESGEFVAEELQRCLACLDPDQQPRQLYYHTDGLSPRLVKTVAGDLSLEAAALPEADPRAALAEGVARGFLERAIQADFRQDNFQANTQRQTQRRAYGGLAVAVVCLFLALIVTMSFRKMAYDKRNTLATESIYSSWIGVPHAQNRGNRPRVGRIQEELGRMERALARGKAERSSELPDSLNESFVLLMSVLGKAPDSLDMELETIRLQGGIVDVTGTVGDLADRIDLEKAISEEPRFQLIKSGVTHSGDNRRKFNLTLSVTIPVTTARARQE